MSKSTNCVIAIAVKAAGVEETEAFIEVLTGAKITKRDDKKEGTLNEDFDICNYLLG